MIQVYLEQLLLDHVLALTAPELIIITGSYTPKIYLYKAKSPPPPLSSSSPHNPNTSP